MTHQPLALQSRVRQSGKSSDRRSLHFERLEDRRMLAGRAADAVNQFGLDVYEFMQHEAGNLFFSPLSVATGLTMAYAGAAGQTAAEMEQVLHLGTAPGIHDAFHTLLSSLDDQAKPQVISAHAMWPAIGLPVNSGFLNTIETGYFGHVEALDYSNPSAAENVINAWVAQQTLGKIEDLVSDLTPDTGMVLTDALYFKAFWKIPFDPQSTHNGVFTRRDGTTVVAPMMTTQYKLGAQYTAINGYNVVNLPFVGSAGENFSMVLIVPPNNSAANLSPELFTQVDAWMQNPTVPGDGYLQLTLPKFKTEVSTDLNELLVGLGMPSAFDPGAANFTLMTPGSVWIDDVFHKAVIQVNEQGTEAAAATKISFLICFAKGTPVLTADGAKPIEELKPGDLVLARDENNLEGEVTPKRVEKVHRNEAAILELHVGGQVVRTTETHPFFVRMRGWTPAGELKRNDMLFSQTGEWIAVDKALLTQETEPVFNLQVADHHTYFVGRQEWGFALWVHNACIPEIVVNRAFHFLIRDNTTSTTLFMGRVDDPTQLQNEVTPAVPPPNANFNGNASIDGGDFLAWQRGFPMSSDARHSNGDSDFDRDVDRDDFGRWTTSFGQQQSAQAMTLLAAPSALQSASGAATASKERLFDATNPFVPPLRVNDGNLPSRAPLRELERFAIATRSVELADDWTPAADSTDAPTSASVVHGEGDCPDRWIELVDALLADLASLPPLAGVSATP